MSKNSSRMLLSSLRKAWLEIWLLRAYKVAVVQINCTFAIFYFMFSYKLTRNSKSLYSRQNQFRHSKTIFTHPKYISLRQNHSAHEECKGRNRHNVECFFSRCTIFRLAKPVFFRYNENFTCTYNENFTWVHSIKPGKRKLRALELLQSFILYC